MYPYSKRFTLIELMFVVTILVILIGIGFVAGTKTLRKQAKLKTKAEIVLLASACQQYKDRYKSFPDESGDEIDFNFVEYLSKVPPNAGYSGSRPMFIDFKKNNINLDNFTAQDPYENSYKYQYKDGTIKIWSIGLNEDDSSDDISN